MSAVAHAPPNASELRYARERMTLERCLATLEAPGASGTEGPATDPQARVARETWRRLLAQEEQPRLPWVGFTEGGALYLSWNYPDVGLSVHIERDGRVEWYASGEGEPEGTPDEPEAALPERFFELARRLHHP